MKIEKSQSSLQSSGFTLIELLVVVVIVGILGSIAAPGWLSYLNRQRVTTVRSELKAVLKDAQTKAQQKSMPYSVVLSSTANGPVAALSTAGSLYPAVTLGSKTQNIQIASFIGSMASTSPLTFDYKGRVAENNIPFVIKITANNNSNGQKCLIVNSPLGSIIEAKESTCNNPNLGL
ncbi:MAG: hypothetical protein DCF25_01620 [Leptolyngbya foveolarum]|uniref:Prepilin-type cleavage/methylation domain-containing protein n=1 Tax=Leptolyngbya foveolarum TaxID=47253 RepID=A0A2W4UQ14_9CYAN|nr:MAG: hypothetical protein DCF25_01620 [Leptolyngbya foveolarum]